MKDFSLRSLRNTWSIPAIHYLRCSTRKEEGSRKYFDNIHLNTESQTSVPLLLVSASECKIQQCLPLFDHQKSAHACSEINM